MAGVHTTIDALYFLSHPGIKRISKDLVESDIPEFKDSILDFGVSRRTDFVYTINLDLKIRYKDKTSPALLGSVSKVHKIKQMYSDHFLVASVMSESHEIHLVSFEGTPTILSHFSGKSHYESTEFVCWRLLKPMNLYAFAILIISESFFLFGVRKQVIYGLTFLKLDKRARSLVHHQNNTWIMCRDFCTMASIEVHFPEALKL